MAVISVPSSATGATYSVRIAGDVPTAEEQARIDAYVAQQESVRSKYFGPSEAAAEEETGGIGSALGVGVDILQQGFGSAVEGFGTSTGIDFLRDYGASVAEANKQQVMEATPGLTGYEDVEDVGSALSFFGETLAQQAPQLGVSIGGGYAGSKLGGAIGTAIAPGVGTAAGAVIGGLAGSILANIPFFYGQNRERQKEVIESTGKDAEVSEGAAFLTSIPQAALDGIVDRLLIGKVIKPDVLSAGGIFTRAVKGAGAGSVVEAPTEIGQQLLERLQAGLPIDDDEAIEEYKQAAIVGGLIGGTVGGTANVLGGDSRKAQKKKDDEAAAAQLEEDQREEAEAASKQIKFGEQPVAEPEAEEDAVTGTLMLPAPTAGAAPQESPVTPEAEAQAQPKRKTVKFRWRDYTAAVQAVAGSGDASIPNIQKASSPDGKTDTPPAIAKAIRARMVADGVIVADKKAKGGYRVVPDAAPPVNPTESYQRTLDDLQKDTDEAAMAREKAVQDARRAEQTGTKADARKFMLQADAAQRAIDTAAATRQEVEARLPSAAASAAVPGVEQPGSLIAGGKAAVPITEAPEAIQTVAVSNRAKRLKQSLDYYQKEAAAKAAQVRQLKEAGKKVQLPKSDIDKIARLEQEAATAIREAASIRAQLTRPAQDVEESRAQVAAAKAKEASVAAERAARTPVYTAKEGQLFTALRRRLDNLGLADVRLVAERVLRPQGAPQNALIEGMMDVDTASGNRIISLALGVYDPKMSQQELFDAISGVMNHEVIHVLRNLGLFTDAEWKTLSDLAARQRYMKLKDGKPVERGYTYLQRAQGMYSSSDPEIQLEEAVAEMFRDYVAGTLKVGGKPKTLMDRIKGFFRAMWKSHEDAGITDPNLIFEGVRFGDIGRRERRAEAPSTSQTEAMLSVLRTKNRDTNLVRDIDELVSYAEAQVSWRDWYDRYQSVLEDLFGSDSGLFRNILSATSQAASVPANVGLAVKAYDQMLSGQPFTGFLPAVIKNLNRIRSEEALSGRKIGEYGRANVGDEEGIAIDRHVAMIMFDVVSPTAQQVEAGKSAIREIASRLGWKPREVQAALWAANIARTGREPQSYDTYLVKKADQIRAIRDRFPTEVTGGDRGGDGARGGADVGTPADGPRFSIKYVADINGSKVPLTDSQLDELSEPIEQTIESTDQKITKSGGFVIRADQVEGMILSDDIPTITPEQMVGMKIIPTIADRTAAGFYYTGIDGAGVHMAIPMLGGPRFPYRITNAERGIVWSNRGKGVITDIENKIAEGATHILVVLGDADMHVSNTTVSNAFFGTLEAYAKQGRFTPENAQKLTDLIRTSSSKDENVKEYLESFPGLSDIEALDGYLHGLSFEARKRLLKILGSKAAASLGAPNMNKVLRATRDREMAANKWGDGVILLELDRANPTVVLGEGGSAPHPDFPLGVRGRVVGRLAAPLNYEMLWSKWVNKWTSDKMSAYDFMASDKWKSGKTWDQRTAIAKDALDKKTLTDEQYALVAADIKSSQPTRKSDGVTVEQFDESIASRDAYISSLNPRRAFELSKPTLELTSEEASFLSNVRPLPIDGYTQARLAADFVAGNWRRSNVAKNKGGVSPQAFLDAIDNSDASATLSNYAPSPDPDSPSAPKTPLDVIKKAIKDGSMLISQLGDGEIYYGLQRRTNYADMYGFTHPDLTDREIGLVSVVSNEQGARGIGGPAVMIDALANGATVLDCFNVKSKKFPNGFLPTFYGEFGFEVLGEIPFDPQYYNDTKLSDLKATWTRDGWKEGDGYPSIAIMKWKGTDDDRRGITSRYLRDGTQGLIAGRAAADAAAAEADVSVQLGAEARAAGGADAGGAAGLEGAGARRSMASRLRETAVYLAALNDVEIQNLGIDQRDRAEAISALTGDRDSSTDFSRRLSIRYAVSPITPAMQKKIQANQQSMLYARSADALAGLISKTRLVEADKAKKFTDGLMRRFQDSMLPIGRMVQELSAKGLTITDAMDTYLQENLMHGVVGERMRVNKAGLYEPVTKAIKRLNVPKARIDQLATASSTAAGGKGYVALSLETGDNPRLVLANAYLYAAHARERNRYIKANKDKANNSGSGMSDAEASAIMQWFASLDPANKAVIADLEKGIRLIVADTNQTRVDGGLLSPTVVDPYNFYVPLRGLLDQDDVTQEDDNPGNRTTPGFGARGREDRRATGRYDYATDIVANVFAQNSNAIVRAERNKVGQSFLKLLRSDPSLTEAYAKVLPYAPKVKVSRGGKMVEVPDQKAYDRPDILVVKEDGKETFVEFTDTTTAGAMNGKNGLSIDTGRGVLRLMGQINRYLATINTSYNPEFVITNMIRDLTTAGVQINQFEMEGLTADALRGVPSALKGITRSIRSNDNTSPWAKVYREFVEAGGQNSTNQMNSIADYTDDIASMLGDISESGIRGKWSSVKNSFVGKGFGSVLNFLEEYNTIVENGIRVSTYKALIDRGVSKERAAQAARNVTVNFAKRGDYGQLMNAYSLFYNASIQGSFALLNAATRSKKVQKILLGVAASGFVMDAVNALISGEDEDGEKIYDKIPDHVLEHNLVLMDFLGLSDRGYIAIPLPYGINLPFNIGRSLTRFGRGGYDSAEAGQSILSTTLDVVNPLGGTESFLNFAAPTVLDPIVDMVENEDFANKPIYKEGLPFDKTPAPDSQMYWSTTSPSAIWMANTLNSLTGGNEVRPGLADMSPDVIQFWFEFVTGGLGRFAMNSAEVPFTVVEEGITAENIRNIPFVKKVIGSVSEREDMTSYIEGAKQILTAGEELKRARESGDAEWAKQTIGRYGAELRLVGPIKSIESNLRKLSKLKNDINRSKTMPEAQKKVMLERIEERRQMLLSRANKLIKDAGL